jgi:hypothetical protein
VIERRGGGVVVAEHRLPQGQQRRGFPPAAGGLTGAAGRQVDDAADCHGDRDVQQQRQEILRLVDREGVQRRSENQFSSRLAAIAASTADQNRPAIAMATTATR